MKRRKVYVPGWAPKDATAWCVYHDRGCNDAYIRKKHCLTKQKGRPCRHLRVLPLDGERFSSHH